MDNKVMEVKFISLWDKCIEIETTAMYNTETGLVYEVEMDGEYYEYSEGLASLQLEYIRLDNNVDLIVVSESSISSEYRVIDFADILKSARRSIDAFYENKKCPEFEEVLIEFAYSNSVKLTELDMNVSSTIIGINSIGCPYIKKNIDIPKYGCSVVVGAHQYEGWSFYIEDFKLLNKSS